MRSPIVTSIPPVLSRRDPEGREIGEDYLARCIASWRACGFDPVTVNADGEALHPLIAELGVEVRRVPRDASAITGRPHVFLGDLLRAACAPGVRRVFVINADVELEADSAARERLHALGQGQAIALRRRDHDGTRDRQAPAYAGGVDMIGAGADLLAGLDCGDLVFGMPWWDHYLPLALWRRNADFVPMAGCALWHLRHGGRWDKRQHMRFGREFLRLLEAGPARPERNPQAEAHVAALMRSAAGHYGGSTRARAAARLLAALLPGSRLHRRRSLRAVSESNIALLDRITGTAHG